MLIVRETFIAKPGNASKLAKLFRRALPADMRIMTDMVGTFNTVEIEMQVEDLPAYEKAMKMDHMKDLDPKLKEELSHYAELYTSGKRELFKLTE